MRVFFWGTGGMAETLLDAIGIIPSNIKILGFVDNDSRKWGKIFKGKKIFSPNEMCSVEFDFIIIVSDIYFEAIKKNLVYWYGIKEDIIKNRLYLLKLLFKEKYKNTKNSEILSILEYWENNNLSIYNQYVTLGSERHTVNWDCIENMPYIMLEDKRMYYPYDYIFPEYDGKKVVIDILAEQQPSSPHRYIKDDIQIKNGDIIADAGVQEGNFSLRYIEKVKKAYLFECDNRWIRPLKKTFEKFKDKVFLCKGILGRIQGGIYVNLDTIIKSDLDFLKMDIEGSEVEALLGGKEILLKNDVKCAICSYHKSGDETAIADLLNFYGYETNTSQGYMVYYYDENIYSSLDFRRGIVYARKEKTK